MFKKKTDVFNEELEKILDEAIVAAREKTAKEREAEEKMTMKDKKARAESKAAAARAAQNLEILMEMDYPKEAKYFDIHREYFEKDNELLKETIEKLEKLLAENDEK